MKETEKKEMITRICKERDAEEGIVAPLGGVEVVRHLHAPLIARREEPITDVMGIVHGGETEETSTEKRKGEKKNKEKVVGALEVATGRGVEAGVEVADGLTDGLMAPREYSNEWPKRN